MSRGTECGAKDTRTMVDRFDDMTRGVKRYPQECDQRERGGFKPLCEDNEAWLKRVDALQLGEAQADFEPKGKCYNDGPHTWDERRLIAELHSLGLQPQSRSWHDYSASKRFIGSWYAGGWVPENYQTLIKWICRFLGL